MSTDPRRNRPRGCMLTAYLLASLAGAAAHAQSPADDEAASPEAVGAVVACAVCHGPEGEGKSRLGAPRIGGLPAWYVERQLENFRRGIRGGSEEDVYGSQMYAMALLLEGDDVIPDLADHVASLMPEWPEQTVTGDAERGEELFSVCVACHGEEGRGSEELNTPSLVGMPDWYLLRQLEYFRDGIRGDNPDDMFGMQMTPIMAMFEDREDLVDLVAYINSLSGTDAPADAPGGQERSEQGSDEASASDEEE